MEINPIMAKKEKHKTEADKICLLYLPTQTRFPTRGEKLSQVRTH